MKKLILASTALLISFSINAQLSNTIWKGSIKGDNPRITLLEFSKDQCILNAADNSLIELMSLTINKNVFSLKKLNGQSDCDNVVVGKYEFVLRKDSLFIKTVDDLCDDRSSALNETSWVKWKKAPEVKVDASILKEYAGVYELDPQHQITILFEDGKLFAESVTNHIPKSQLIPHSASKFLLQIAAVELTFVKDASGKVLKFIAHDDKDYEFKKIK